MRRLRVAILLAILTGTAPAATAQTGGEFFAGKTLRIVIGFDIAGTYGQYAQVAANHIRHHFPANPTVIVQQMPGAGGLVALNNVANVAPKDGTVAIIAPINIVQDGLLNPLAKYDPSGFEWIGRMMELVQLGVANEKSGVASIEDAKTRSVSSGGIGATNPTAMSWHILNMMAGTRFNVVSGYKGLPDATLAWERGEVDTVMMNWETMTDRFMEPVNAGKIKVLFAYAGRPLPEIAGRPVLGEFGRTPVEKAFLRIYTVGPEIGRSLALAKGVPAERIAAWRSAFDRMRADPEFTSEVKRRRLRYDPLNGVEIGAIVAGALEHSAETLAGVRALYERLLATAQ